LREIGSGSKRSKVLSNFFAGLIVACGFLFFLVFASIAAAYALSAWIGKMYAGFLIVSGIYFLLGIIIWNGREKFLRIPVMNAMIRQLLKKDEENEQD
jgi:hypothetical protein